MPDKLAQNCYTCPNSKQLGYCNLTQRDTKMVNERTQQCLKSIAAWQLTLSKYEQSRTTETDPKRKAFWTRNINRAKRTIEAFERDARSDFIVSNFKSMTKQGQEDLLKTLESRVSQIE